MQNDSVDAILDRQLPQRGTTKARPERLAFGADEVDLRATPPEDGIGRAASGASKCGVCRDVIKRRCHHDLFVAVERNGLSVKTGDDKFGVCFGGVVCKTHLLTFTLVSIK